jgi:L-asparaginase II
MAETLVHVLRGNLIESIHRGDLAVVDWKGNLLYHVGSPKEKITFIRSSSKPIQALPVLESGAADRFGLTEEELALLCASHNGEQRHIDAVARILEKIGLGQEALKCGSHLPLFKDAAQAMVQRGEKPTEVHSNCSGKHSGMLALAQHMNWDVEGYTELAHPVQQVMLEKMALFARLRPADIEIGIDGCGVPVYGLSVYHMALAYARLANPSELGAAEQKNVHRITQAMMKDPFMVAGTGRLCTSLMKVAGGAVFTKSGAEGVQCVGVPSLGIGLAVKAEDGNGARCSTPAAIEALRQLSVLSEEQVQELKSLANPTLYNFRRDEIGEVRAAFTLQRAQS